MKGSIMDRPGLRGNVLVRILAGLVVAGLLLPSAALCSEQELQQRLDAMSWELESLKEEVRKNADQERELAALREEVRQVSALSLGRWLRIGGDYRFRFDYLHGSVPSYWQLDPSRPAGAGNPARVPAFYAEDKSLYTHRFGLNIQARALEDVTVTSRLLVYKVTGGQDDSAIVGAQQTNPFFADRAGVFDGSLGHVPSDGKLLVDQAYVTWRNIGALPLWISAGRRPTTGGSPSHLRLNNDRPDRSSVPSLIFDYAFDGLELGYAPAMRGLPGGAARFIYGRVFESNKSRVGAGIHDSDLFGVALAPLDTPPLRVDFQWNRLLHVNNRQVTLTGPSAGTTPSVQLGEIDWFALGVLGRLRDGGRGWVNLFASAGVSVAHPNGHVSTLPDGVAEGGLLFDAGQPAVDRTGWAVYLGGRYDIAATRTKLGIEYNHGSAYWFSLVPAADDMWTSKVGTRGDVYEAYVIQEIGLKPVSSYLSRLFFRAGYQYYRFEYSGSNNWIGAPVRISQLDNPAHHQLFTPLKFAENVYMTFEVRF